MQLGFVDFDHIVVALGDAGNVELQCLDRGVLRFENFLELGIDLKGRFSFDQQPRIDGLV